jgi:hypothetical protein
MPYFVTLGIMPCRGGMGVFIQQWIPANTRILEFTGKIVDREMINLFATKGSSDSFLQVGDNEFVGASGRLDDYVNHSCDPNCGLEFEGDRIYLKSIKVINRGSEITYDYATSQYVFPLRFKCRCDNPGCRGEIGDFDELSAKKKRFYLSKHIVAPFLVSKEASQNGKSSKKMPPIKKLNGSGAAERENL